MGGGKSGGGKGGTPNVNIQPSPYEQAMANIAKDYYKATGPTRGYFLEDWASFLRPPGGTGYGAGTGGYYTPGYYTGGTPGTSTGGSTGGGTAATGALAFDYSPYGYQMGPSGGLNPIYTGNTAPKASLTQQYQQPQLVGYSGQQTPIFDVGGNLFYAQDTTGQPGLYNAFSQSLADYNKAMEVYGSQQKTDRTGGTIAQPTYKPVANTFGYLSTAGDRVGGGMPNLSPYQGPTEGVTWIPGYTPGAGGTGGSQGQYVPGQYIPDGGGGGAGNLYGGYDPYKIPGYAPLYQLARGGLESQFGQARENIIGSMPRGGAMGENLSNLEMARAVQAGSLPAQIATPLIQDIMSKAYGAAFAAPQTSLAGLGGAASSYAGRYGSAMSGTMANQGGGLGLGSLAAMGLGGLGGGGKGGKAAAPVEYAMGGGLFI